MTTSNRLLTDTLISEVRSIISERNGEGLDDELDILPALNRGQDKACSILAKHHADPLFKLLAVTLITNQTDYDIPEDALEDRIVKMEVNINSRYLEMKRVRPTDFGLYETPATSTIPLAYGIIGRKYRILPQTSAVYPLRMMYMFQPPKLALQQGRITAVDTATETFTIAELNADLTTAVLEDTSYLSIIDGQTGMRKGVVRVSSKTSTATQQRITIATSIGSGRTTLDNVAVNTTLVGLGAAVDDYICFAPDTCISILRAPVLNFITADGFEDDVKSLWAGQEQDLRVKSRSSIWGGSRRLSWPYPNSRGVT